MKMPAQMRLVKVIKQIFIFNRSIKVSFVFRLRTIMSGKCDVASGHTSQTKFPRWGVFFENPGDPSLEKLVKIFVFSCPILLTVSTKGCFKQNVQNKVQH